MAPELSIGIIGGTGQLGSAIARGLLRQGHIGPEKLWVSGRPGSASEFAEGLGIQLTTCNQQLVDACQLVILSLPPQLLATLNIKAPERLVVSLMAGVSIAQITQQTAARRIVRAMSNPAAEIGLAYSPWCANAAVTAEDRALVRGLFAACGLTDEVPDERQVAQFTALTGPVPGFVAYYADCMVDYAVNQGIDPALAKRAICQLFHASGVMLAEAQASPKEHVSAMIAYAGTTAAGLEAMQGSPLAASIAQGLEAAYQRARQEN